MVAKLEGVVSILIENISKEATQGKQRHVQFVHVKNILYMYEMAL
jgi:hypothetical protein